MEKIMFASFISIYTLCDHWSGHIIAHWLTIVQKISLAENRCNSIGAGFFETAYV